MKKIFSLMFLLCAACLAFTACDTDDEDGVAGTGTPTNPEKEVAGVYTGVYTQDKNGTLTTADGTLTLEATEKAYITNVTVACPTFSLNYSSVANITPAYSFYNNFPTNGFGTNFNGSVKDGKAIITFQSKVKEGRKWVVATFTFEGTKQ